MSVEASISLSLKDNLYTGQVSPAGTVEVHSSVPAPMGPTNPSHAACPPASLRP